MAGLLRVSYTSDVEQQDSGPLAGANHRYDLTRGGVAATAEEAPTTSRRPDTLVGPPTDGAGDHATAFVEHQRRVKSGRRQVASPTPSAYNSALLEATGNPISRGGAGNEADPPPSTQGQQQWLAPERNRTSVRAMTQSQLTTVGRAASNGAAATHKKAPLRVSSQAVPMAEMLAVSRLRGTTAQGNAAASDAVPAGMPTAVSGLRGLMTAPAWVEAQEFFATGMADMKVYVMDMEGSSGELKGPCAKYMLRALADGHKQMAYLSKFSAEVVIPRESSGDG